MALFETWQLCHSPRGCLFAKGRQGWWLQIYKVKMVPQDVPCSSLWAEDFAPVRILLLNLAGGRLALDAGLSKEPLQRSCVMKNTAWW